MPVATSLKRNMPNEWSSEEVEASVADYMTMLASELAGVPYNKAAHRRKLSEVLNGRTEQAIEFKHANISAVLIDLGFPYIDDILSVLTAPPTSMQPPRAALLSVTPPRRVPPTSGAAKPPSTHS